MSIRNGRLPPAAMCVLTTMARLQQQGVPVGWRGLTRSLGYRSANAITRAMTLLVAEGLVGYELAPGGKKASCGTFHPTCRFIPADDLGKEQQ